VNSEQFNQWCQAIISPSLAVDYSSPPLIMGILNITPDSFSDGGCYTCPDHAYEQAMSMIAQGADIIDIGGESSKPGAVPVSCAEELARVIPVIERIRAVHDVCISIDTCKAEVMQSAVSAGASMINDITALTGEGALSMAASLQVPVCLMHMQGVPASMQDNPLYHQDVVDEINLFFQQRITTCLQAGIARHQLILDPGFGFGKLVRHNLQLVQRFAEFQQHKQPLLLGVSRKSTLGTVLQKPVGERMPGGVAVSVFAAMQGANIIRTHDVDETRQALQMLHAIVSTT